MCAMKTTMGIIELFNALVSKWMAFEHIFYWTYFLDTALRKNSALDKNHQEVF